jgi:NADH-quinone oxidoreductase subunit F
MSSFTPLLLANRRTGTTAFLAEYTAGGGYRGLRQALTMAPKELVDLVKAAGLRGRGGAGFPTGVKWSFFPADDPGPKYLLCNCDEMEPGTYKDGLLLRVDPHQLVEGMIIAAYALRIPVGYIFIRYAYEEAARNLQRAIAEAKDAGYLGTNILGSGFSLELHVHRSAGRYICGEETSQLNSLEGLRPNPRRKPPFPALRGLFGRPTTINNVETLANIQHIVNLGAEGWKSLSREGMSGGSKLFGLSGHLVNTDCFELPLGITLGEIVNEYGGGVRSGHTFKACLPGGASTPYLTRDHFDLPFDFDSLAAAGSRLGTAAVTVFDETTCMVAATHNLIQFFARESCGWCTPCRDGLAYVAWLLETIENGQGTKDDIDTLRDQLKNINGHSFCALAEGAMGPLEGLLRHFEEELYDHVNGGGCPFGPSR